MELFCYVAYYLNTTYPPPATQDLSLLLFLFLFYSRLRKPLISLEELWCWAPSKPNRFWRLKKERQNFAFKKQIEEKFAKRRSWGSISLLQTKDALLETRKNNSRRKIDLFELILKFKHYRSVFTHLGGIHSSRVIVPTNFSNNVLDRIFNQTQAICFQANNRTRGNVSRRFGAQEVQDQGEEEQPQIVQLSFKWFPNNFKQLFAFSHKFCQCHCRRLT